MIVVFVVDTSPSMSRPVSSAVGGMSRLDLAKQVVEDLSRRIRKGCNEHNSLHATTNNVRSLGNVGQGPSREDALLLLSTSRQHPDTAACAAGGRLLVGFGGDALFASAAADGREPYSAPDPAGTVHHRDAFQRELKGLRAYSGWDPNHHPGETFPEEAGGAVGLNAALSAGLQLLSRYRLQHSLTENFGMGRLPNAAIQTATGAPASATLQSAVLILVTDGACLRQPASAGGGSLQLQYGSQPLREFYREPFRWDQRVFCLAIGDNVNEKGQYLHPQLRALCEVTGGSHWLIRKPSGLPTDQIMKHLRPPMPREMPLPDPLFLSLGDTATPHLTSTVPSPPGLSFVNAGPVCCFQALEADEGRPPVQRRAMLLYTGSTATTAMTMSEGGSLPTLSQPLWCIPEAFFPSKKLDTLPPRSAQPLLYFSKYPANLGLKSFEPLKLIKLLHRLDQAVLVNRKLAGQPARFLHRDVYVCEWLSPEGCKPIQVSISSRQEYFPVVCPGAGRTSLSDEGESFINIGILHAPLNCSTLGSLAPPNRLATLTLLPPEPHILLPLLVRAAEAEHRVLKRAAETMTSTMQRLVTPLDEHWRNEFQAYMFRLPPYYHHCLKRCLRFVLPSSAHSLLLSDGAESLPLQCFSKNCLQKIRNAEHVARDTNERLERQEASVRQQYFGQSTSDLQGDKPLRYGQYDPRSSVDSYLAALRSMPPPWRGPGSGNKPDGARQDLRSETASTVSDKDAEASPRSVGDLLGDLPAQCLMAYYESRRRWIFGGPSLSTQGLHVEGVNNSGSNSHKCGRTWKDRDECPLSLAGVGVSVMNESSTAKMGDYRERLLFSRSPVVGYGSNDSAGVAATTAADGSPVWSVDDDAMPVTFFDPKTGEFADSVQARVRSRLMVNFGNPYKEKRADSLIPEKFYSQAPSMQQGGFGSIVGSPRTPPGSPPHESFDSVEEGEAIFVRTSPSRSSPKREDFEDMVAHSQPKRQRTDSVDESEAHPFSEKPDTVAPFDKSAESKPPAPPKRPPPVPTKTPTTPVPTLSTHPPLSSPSTSGSQSRAVPPKKVPPPPPRPPPPKPPQAPTPSPKSAHPAPAKADRPPVSGSGRKSPAVVHGSTASLAPSFLAAPSPVVEPQATPKPQALPPPPQQHHRGSMSVATGAPPPPPAAEAPQSPDQKPLVDLPLGWMCVWSKSQKRWYFFDTKTNKSVWKWPPGS